MMWRKITQRNGYKIATEVFEDGTYTQYIEWDDGTKTNKTEMNLLSMGYNSVFEFIRNNSGFVEVV